MTVAFSRGMICLDANYSATRLPDNVVQFDSAAMSRISYQRGNGGSARCRAQGALSPLGSPAPVKITDTRAICQKKFTSSYFHFTSDG